MLKLFLRSQAYKWFVYPLLVRNQYWNWQNASGLPDVVAHRLLKTKCLLLVVSVDSQPGENQESQQVISGLKNIKNKPKKTTQVFICLRQSRKFSIFLRWGSLTVPPPLPCMIPSSHTDHREPAESREPSASQRSTPETERTAPEAVS